MVHPAFLALGRPSLNSCEPAAHLEKEWPGGWGALPRSGAHLYKEGGSEPTPGELWVGSLGGEDAAVVAMGVEP